MIRDDTQTVHPHAPPVSLGTSSRNQMQLWEGWEEIPKLTEINVSLHWRNGGSKQKLGYRKRNINSLHNCLPTGIHFETVVSVVESHTSDRIEKGIVFDAYKQKSRGKKEFIKDKMSLSNWPLYLMLSYSLRSYYLFVQPHVYLCLKIPGPYSSGVM